MGEIPLNSISTFCGTERKREESYCPHYKRSTCLLHFSCCEQDVFFPCHKCHNESSPTELDVPLAEKESLNGSMKTTEENEVTEQLCATGSATCSKQTDYHPQAKGSDAVKMKCTNCLTLQKIDSKCNNCSKDFAEYFCEKCKIFLNDMEMDPYHCDHCGICRAKKSDHKHCFKCNLCLNMNVYKKHNCMEGSGHDVCGVCLETVFTGCCFLPCSHKIHQKCVLGLLQHGSFNCPICRSTFIVQKKGIGICQTLTNSLKKMGNQVFHFVSIYYDKITH